MSACHSQRSGRYCGEGQRNEQRRKNKRERLPLTGHISKCTYLDMCEHEDTRIPMKYILVGGHVYSPASTCSTSIVGVAHLEVACAFAVQTTSRER